LKDSVAMMKDREAWLLVGWLEFNIPFQHKYGYIRDKRHGCYRSLIVTDTQPF